MEKPKPVLCSHNEDLALFMWKKRQEIIEAKGIPDRIDSTLGKAYANVCSTKNPIRTIKELSQVKGVGQWTLRLMKKFFQNESTISSSPDLGRKGNKNKAPKRYVPQKNSAAYALLITLYRGVSNGSTFMQKQELINAAEASGLSRVPIAPEKGNGKLTHLGSSSREWYSGWNCMKTLIKKGLIVKSSCPAKYMLTEEGHAAARECLSRSDVIELSEDLTTECRFLSHTSGPASHLIHIHHFTANPDASAPSLECRGQRTSQRVKVGLNDEQHSPEQIGYSCIFSAHSQKDAVYSLDLDSDEIFGNACPLSSSQCTYDDTEDSHMMDITSCRAQHALDASCPADSCPGCTRLRACSSIDNLGEKSLDVESLEARRNALVMPPFIHGEEFENTYDIILILDDREQYTRSHQRSLGKIIESISTQFNVKIEVRRLPVGDAIWIARHKQHNKEFVLDFIVERKKVDDLYISIRDNRYREQKLKLVKCGLRKVIYIVEGDPNSCDRAESIKTACFTTEILEGFDVQRTRGLSDTLRKYCYLTHSIQHYYRIKFSDNVNASKPMCPTFEEFIRKCKFLDRMTVSEVFAIQLMQVRQVTEEVVYAVLGLYPCLLSLVRAYSRLEGDVRAQEDLLSSQSSLIGRAASKNICKFVWSS